MSEPEKEIPAAETSGAESPAAETPAPEKSTAEKPSAEKPSGENPTAEKSPAGKKPRKKRRVFRAIRSFLLQTLGLALVIYILLFHIVGLAVMPSGDMFPRMDAGDLLLFYRLDQKWKAQDIVVIDKAVTSTFAALEKPAETGERPWWRQALDFLKVPDPEKPATTRFICRVVAAPGDTVEVTENRLIINGNAMIESGIYYSTHAYAGYTEYPVKLGPDEYFVMADFRNGGVDSRFFGPVTKDEIQGTVITVIRRNNL